GEELVLALALQRDDAGGLAIGKIERDVVELGAELKIAHREPGVAVVGGWRLICHPRGGDAGLLDAGAEHHLDDPFLDAWFNVDDADGGAVAQHGGAVAEGGDLDETVRDEDDRSAAVALA